MPGKQTDVSVVGAEVYFLEAAMRVPLKFGTEVTTGATLARVRLTVRDAGGREAQGWGEAPLAVAWTWPAQLAVTERNEAMKSFSLMLAEAWAGFETAGHPIEIGWAFLETRLGRLLDRLNADRPGGPMPHLSALVCCSAFDIALHDAYGNLHAVDVYRTYNAEYMNADLSAILTPADGADVSFAGLYPEEFLVLPAPRRIPAWHLVGGKDPVTPAELTGAEPDDGLPVLLRDWIRRDGLNCLKVKLRGNDAAWDYDRLVAVGVMAIEEGADWLTADFNCTVSDPAYVNHILDRLVADQPRVYGMVLYVEQPFPYDLEANRIDAHSVSARKPLFMDESAHDWRLVRLGRTLGWTGVALKTCKTQTGALLSLCWAKAHGMTLMVQDLTNPMLAQIPHCRLGAHAGTIMGVETNGMQFFLDVSAAEAAVHPGLYTRRDGMVDLSSVGGPGMGYRIEEIDRELPEAAVRCKE